ncbi:MAG TPA: hypothetical protein DD738_06095, partial [Ruminiclostridium sp.]|nr:hypothetical protein [Ruminiclostridium sp.]
TGEGTGTLSIREPIELIFAFQAPTFGDQIEAGLNEDQIEFQNIIIKNDYAEFEFPADFELEGAFSAERLKYGDDLIGTLSIVDKESGVKAIRLLFDSTIFDIDDEDSKNITDVSGSFSA